MKRGRLTAPNYRGAPLPVVLGLLLIAPGAVAGALGLGLADLASGSRHVGEAAWVTLVGSLLVFGAGLIDDLTPIGPRGLRGHLRSLLAGHMTTGILKMLVAVAASIVTVASLPHRSATTQLSGVVVVAGCTNLWNGLDVRPGRALKAFLVAGLAVLAGGLDGWTAPTVPGVVLAAIPALPLDLRERAMLGDGGSNLLGFTAGLGIYLVLPGWGVGVAACLAVALNVVAETVTLSRLIEAVPPLRWADGLGRRRPEA